MPTPTNEDLYEKIKTKIYKKIKKHSAYRSGILVQKYKTAFTKKYGKKKSPYKGKKTHKKGLKRWFDEEWVNQKGKIGYQHKHDIYRPSKRITKKTPITHGELTKKEIEKARREKYRTGRVRRFRKKKMVGGAKEDSEIIKNFKPNLTPRQIFKMGSFGGTYWRPIYSSVNNKKYKNVHKKYPKSWWKDIPEKHLSSSEYDKSINKHNVIVGTSLEFWEGKDWIKSTHPYGWVHWYCDYYNGKRSNDDLRQMRRWDALAGPNGRFTKFLTTQIMKKGGIDKWNDESISPKIRQVLQHWGYKLTKKDFEKELERRNK
jgi:hypothetical protein